MTQSVEEVSNPYGGDDRTTVFTLPVSGSVRLYNQEMRVVSSHQFQRLAYIKQLGTANLVFRGATHTRLDHSLGTLAEAERIIRRVNSRPSVSEYIDQRARKLIRLSALLHDITHVPFSHTIEDELGLLVRHDYNTARRQRLLFDSELGEILYDILGGPADVDAFIQLQDALVAPERDLAISELDYPYAADIIGNTVCADMLDYVQRDLLACGLPLALGDRFLDFFTITPSTVIDPADRRRMALALEKRGMPRPDVESEVVKLLTYRYELVERVYFHHGKNSASVMLGRALIESGIVSGSEYPSTEDSHFDELSDEMLLRAIADPELARLLGLRKHRRNRAQLRIAAQLGQGILNRHLYKIAYLGVYDDFAERANDLYGRFRDPSSRRALEDEFASAGGLPLGHVLVHLPSPSMLLKLAEVRVLTQRGRVITLEEWDSRHSRRASALNEAHVRLWRVTAYVHPAATDQQRALVRAAAEETFGERSRYLTGAQGDRYIETVFDLYAKEEGWDLHDRECLRDVAALSMTDRNPQSARAFIRSALALGRDAQPRRR